ncbi:MAG: cytochrome C [Vulcanimicrobiaceae bacterium]
MKVNALWSIALVVIIASSVQAHTDPLVERGRYLVAYGSCNDCHTPGWRNADGKIPVSEWMTGSKIGYRGPWGTSYAANVRLEFQTISEGQWLFMVRTRGGHWPMVWHDLRELTTDDQRAIYRFVKSLGPRGTPVPSALPPSKEPTTPYMWVMPQEPHVHV